MALSTGSRIGPYELGALIDEGGMGAVYRARDTRLGRDVAVKVLPEAFTDDEERLLRFEREARLLASMSHPNIAAVHGLEELDGVGALIMELVEGRTLADRLSEGPLEAAEALGIARQVCEALEAAHERGVVHRDLKPANVMVGSGGRVKVLDFGLAKPVEMESGHVTDPVDRGTRQPATRSGMILGTPPYMSPEQLEGGSADPRTDIWAFGCLLYEMLVGRSPFARSTVWQSVAAVLEQEPDLDRLPGGTPWRIRLLLERCLRKDPGKRLHHVADARIEVEEALTEGEASGWGRKKGGRRRWSGAARTVLTMAVVALTAASLAWAVSRGSTGSGSAGPVTFSVPLPSGVSIGPGEVSTYIAVSPDGGRLTFVGNSSNSPLRVHDFATGTTNVLEGTQGAASPFWSPDGRLIGFFAEGRLKKVAVGGGPVETISDATWEAGNSWSADGVILFSQPVDGGMAIHRVSEDGGTPTPVTETDPERDFAHFWPHFLPDGRHFLYLALERSPDTGPLRTLYVASLDADEPQRPLLRSVSRAVYAPPGMLLYVTNGVLVAHPFDADRLALTGDPEPVTDRLRYFYMTGQAEFSASRTADQPVIAFHGGPWESRIQRYGRSGETLGPLTEPAAFDQLRISPDGTRAVVDVLDPANGGRDLWLYDLRTTASRRLTLHPADEQDPVWSPDGREILYRSDENGPPDLYVRSADGSGTPRRVLSGGAVFTPEDWSADGRGVYQVASRSTGLDQWILDLDAEGAPRPLLDTPYREWGGTFSPDGRWIAFVSDESGQSQIYVAPVDDPGARRPLTVSGGIAPRWRDDGEIVFLGPGRTVMAVDVRTEPVLEADEPRILFELDEPAYAASYDVSPDGDLFLVNEVVEDARRAPIQVIMNWRAGGESENR